MTWGKNLQWGRAGWRESTSAIFAGCTSRTLETLPVFLALAHTPNIWPASDWLHSMLFQAQSLTQLSLGLLFCPLPLHPQLGLYFRPFLLNLQLPVPPASSPYKLAH